MPPSLSATSQSVTAAAIQLPANIPPALLAALNNPTRGLSAVQLLRFIPLEPDAHNARYVRIIQLRKRTLKLHNRTTNQHTHHEALFTTTLTHIPDQRPRTHKQIIYAADPIWLAELSRCPALKISCDCERHKFVWEYALWKRGASDIVYCNGRPPQATNPSLLPGACKHLFKALFRLKSDRL